jgi:hypothetical protein
MKSLQSDIEMARRPAGPGLSFGFVICLCLLSALSLGLLLLLIHNQLFFASAQTIRSQPTPSDLEQSIGALLPNLSGAAFAANYISAETEDNRSPNALPEEFFVSEVPTSFVEQKKTGIFIVDGNFVPRIADSEKPANSLSRLPVGDDGALTEEALRIISRMTPEQIDALTLLILSDGSVRGVGQNVVPVMIAADAPWIGDWDSTEMSENGFSQNNSLHGKWLYQEQIDGNLTLEIPEKPFSQVGIRPGMVLGEFGLVSAIEMTEEMVVVRFVDSQMIEFRRNVELLKIKEQDLDTAQRNSQRMEIVRQNLVEKLVNERSVRMPGGEDQLFSDLAWGFDRPAVGEQMSLELDGVQQGEQIGTESWVQVASFSEAMNAIRTAEVFEMNGFQTEVSKAVFNGKDWHVVRVGRPNVLSSELLASVRDQGFSDAFLVETVR